MKFSLTQTKAGYSSRVGARGFAPPLVLAVLLCAAAARAQDTNAPHAPAAPAVTVAPKPARPVAQAAPAVAPVRPRQVVTVVHRLSGWKLLAWLATSDPSSLEVEELPSPTDVHTNIVAGYVSDDGRTVVARLPQAEADLDSFPAPSTSLFPATAPAAPKPEPEYTVITSDGRRVEAKFVGLDSATGLSLLEASSSLMSNAPAGTQGDTEDPTVGQRVRLYAPAPSRPTAAPPAAGVIYLNIDEKEGRLTEVRSGPSGRPFRLVAQTPEASPEWTGAVAANEIGEVLGIVSQTGSGETQIVPVATVRGALERVMRLRASAPQPWLGVRGDAAFQAPLQTWVNFGWKPEFALPHIQDKRGVFLTSVARDTPAALAGLKPGDLISRVGAKDVRSPQDLSLTLAEAGVGSSLDFTVWRAFEPAPLKFTVRLAAAQNPAIATAVAEARAADYANVLNPAAAPEALKAYEEANFLKTFGLDGLRLSPRGAARLGARGGLLVVAVRPGSPAADCGLRAGDVIETANGAQFTLAEFRHMLSNRSAEALSLGVVRGGARTDLPVNPAEAPRP
jgi:S1-C subfamily serine protease